MNTGPAEGRTQRRIHFTGRVQGVGFRYTCISIAKRYPVDGYVKNLANGSVEMVVSGATRPVNEFLAEVQRTFDRNIENCTVEEIQPAELMNGFHVRY